jgi:hypothetical protein
VDSLRARLACSAWAWSGGHFLFPLIRVCCQTLMNRLSINVFKRRQSIRTRFHHDHHPCLSIHYTPVLTMSHSFALTHALDAILVAGHSDLDGCAQSDCTCFGHSLINLKPCKSLLVKCRLTCSLSIAQSFCSHSSCTALTRGAAVVSFA